MHWCHCHANSTGSSVPCDWRGPKLAGPLHDTHMHTLESAVFNRFVECSSSVGRWPHQRPWLRAPSMYLIPYPANDIHVIFNGVLSRLQGEARDAFDKSLQRYHERVKRQLMESSAWKRCGGCDHVLVVSRTSSDFPQRCPWGCGMIDINVEMPSHFPTHFFPPESLGAHKFRLDDPFWANVTVLTQEQIPPAHVTLANVFPMARPTSVHPRSASELRAWQEQHDASRRGVLFTLAASRKGHRSHLVDKCIANPRVCIFLNCGLGGRTKANPCFTKNLYAAYARSVYCLMPHGDTPSRRAIFDALATGCIPIIYHRYSFHWPWHVPDRSAAALLVPTPAPWARQPTALERAARTLKGALGSWLGGGRFDERLPDWMGDPADFANSSQTLENAFERTIALVRARSNAEVVAQRRFLIWKLLPKVIYHYGDREADDAVTVGLRHIRKLIDERMPSRAAKPSSSSRRGGRAALHGRAAAWL